MGIRKRIAEMHINHWVNMNLRRELGEEEKSSLFMSIARDPNPDALLNVIAHDPESNIMLRCEAISRIKDFKLISRLAQLGDSPIIRATAVGAVNSKDRFSYWENDLIEAAAELDESPTVRLEAVSKVRNLTLLEHIYHNDPDSLIREIALYRRNAARKIDIINNKLFFMW